MHCPTANYLAASTVIVWLGLFCYATFDQAEMHSLRHTLLLNFAASILPVSKYEKSSTTPLLHGTPSKPTVRSFPKKVLD